MGTNTIPEATDGTVIPASDHNSLRTSQIGDLVPRNSSGAAQADSGSLGTQTYPWAKANISQGYLFPGQIIMFHDFNGALTPGKGWMKCNGDVVNETNYDAIHGAGEWDDHASGSPLSGKNLPDFNGKYPEGIDNTVQDGTSAITATGNSGHINSSADHFHNIFIDAEDDYASTTIRQHKAYFSGALSSSQEKTHGEANMDNLYLPAIDQSNNGGTSDPNGSTTSKMNMFATEIGMTAANNASLSTDDNAVGNIDVQPYSIEVEYWIKVI